MNLSANKNAWFSLLSIWGNWKEEIFGILIRLGFDSINNINYNVQDVTDILAASDIATCIKYF